MASSTMSVSVPAVARREFHITVRLTGLRIFNVRLWLMRALLWLAGRVGPIDIVVEDERT